METGVSESPRTCPGKNEQVHETQGVGDPGSFSRTGHVAPTAASLWRPLSKVPCKRSTSTLRTLCLYSRLPLSTTSEAALGGVGVAMMSCRTHARLGEHAFSGSQAKRTSEVVRAKHTSECCARKRHAVRPVRTPLAACEKTHTQQSTQHCRQHLQLHYTPWSGLIPPTPSMALFIAGLRHYVRVVGHHLYNITAPSTSTIPIHLYDPTTQRVGL